MIFLKKTENKQWVKELVVDSTLYGTGAKPPVLRVVIYCEYNFTETGMHVKHRSIEHIKQL